MNLPNELWYQIYNYLSPRSISKISCIHNLYQLSPEEIRILDQYEDFSWFFATRSGYTKVLEIWINRGVDVNKQNHVKSTALISSSCGGLIDCVEFLIKSGANVNHQNSYGYTALHWACDKGHIQIIKLLLNAGADANIKNKYGDIPRHWAIRYNRKNKNDVLEILDNHSVVKADS